MKIAICTLAIGNEYKKVVEPSQNTKRLYCEMHGYDYIDDESVYDNTRPIPWSKILLIQKYLANYDYIVWIDADAMIMDNTQKLEDKILLMEGKDIMCIEHFNDINTGVLFVKNTEYSHAFMSRLYSKKEFINFPNWEQDAFIHMYKTEEKITDHVIILSFHYERQIQDYWFSFQPYCSFILHYAGYRGKLKELARDINRDCPLRLENEVEGSYLFRMNWHKNHYREYVDTCLSIRNMSMLI